MRTTLPMLLAALLCVASATALAAPATSQDRKSVV